MTTITRRNLFKILGTGVVASGLEACSDVVPPPKVRTRRGPERAVTTVCGGCPSGCGIKVRVVGEDVVRVSGAPGHPLNDGGLCPRGLAEIQNLYHPERLATPVAGTGDRSAAPRTTLSYDEAIARVAKELQGPVIIGVGEITPLERALVDRLAAKVGATVVPVGLGAGRRPTEAYERYFGTPELAPDFTKADLVLSLGSDWLQDWESPVEAQRTFAALRRAEHPARLVTADARQSSTAACSDEWLPVATGEEGFLALVLARAVLSADKSRAERWPGVAELLNDESLALEAASTRLGVSKQKLTKVAELVVAAQRPVVLVDASASPAAQAAALALQVLADGPRPTLVARNVPAPEGFGASTAKWQRTLPASDVPAAVLLVGANPRFLEPLSGWPALLQRARFVASVSPYLDESALAADVVIPHATALESKQLVWGAAMDGTSFVSAGPAVVEPVHATPTFVDVLLRLARAADPSLPWKDADAVHAAAAEALGAAKALEEGGSVRTEGVVAPAPALVADAGTRLAEALKPLLAPPVALAAGDLHLKVYVPHAFLGGLGAQLPYLHGLTTPAGREAWRTVVELHPDSAARLGISDRGPVVLHSPKGVIRGVAHLRQGIRPDTVSVAAGLGRRSMGLWADGHGDNPLALASPGASSAVSVRRI